MEKSSSDDLVEEREEFMVLQSEKNPILRKAYFLKPFVTAIDDPAPELPCEAISPPLDVKLLPFRVSFAGWKLANEEFMLWVEKMAALHKPTWEKAGIFCAIMASTYRIHRNRDLILAVAEKWCPETKTFIFSFGEATVTLEDVMILLGFSVLGSPVFAPLESSEKRETKKKLDKVWLEITKGRGHVNQVSWLSRFMNNSDEIELEHEAFLVSWLSNFVFPSRHCKFTKDVIPIAIHLARGTRIALAPAVLAGLYQDLDSLKNHIRSLSKSKLVLSSLFSLVQVWSWERFSKLRPKPRKLRKGEPRLARWHHLKHKSVNVKQRLANSGTESFDWRPYTKRVKNWNFPRFYAEEGTWVQINPNLDDEFVSFAQCLRVSQLFGINCVENYHPNRVALQFGIDQDLPGHANQSESVQWASCDYYNRPMNGLKLYIPSRHSTPLVTARYLEWFKKSPECHGSSATWTELSETFIACNTGDHESAKELPLSFVFQKELENRGFVPPGFVSKGKRSKKHKFRKNRIAAAEILRSNRNKDESLSMDTADGVEPSSSGYCQNRVLSESAEDDIDNPTIAQIIKYCRKPCDVEERGGHADEPVAKRTKHMEENYSFDPPQKAISVDNEPPEMRQKGEEHDEAVGKEKKIMMENPSDESKMESNEGNGAEGNGFGTRETKKCSEQIDNLTNSNELLDNGVEREDDFGDGMVVSIATEHADIDGCYGPNKHSVEVPGLELEMQVLELKKNLAEIREWITRKQSRGGVSARF
ncbi:PREDICTED: uncharacterized protein LOC104817874 [Tarenaya hassleriana]|uniref:uncharacterized protein LOC104817874 n=1 Tax=Tarenaya hassleriana TaxID=28532 RepID=UPI00053C8B57|nr:PREDICTED: uncharacterized protein LOC104817874 [Tarenaya hassleriana]